MDFDAAIGALHMVYASPPFDDTYRTYSRRSYLEFCLTVAEVLRGDREDTTDTRLVYNQLSAHAQQEIDPARGGVGISEVVFSHGTLAVEEKGDFWTLYSIGWATANAYTALKQFGEPDAGRVAKAYDRYARADDSELLKKLFYGIGEDNDSNDESSSTDGTEGKDQSNKPNRQGCNCPSCSPRRSPGGRETNSLNTGPGAGSTRRSKRSRPMPTTD
jgi:hypothetical protein